jgi:hypothetical protein
VAPLDSRCTSASAAAAAAATGLQAMHALDKQQLNRAESGAHVQLARALCVPGPLLVEVTSSTCRALEFEFGIGIGPAAGQLIVSHVSATSLLL